MRKLTTTSIFNDDELVFLADGVRQVVGENVTLAAEAYGVDLRMEVFLKAMKKFCYPFHKLNTKPQKSH